MRLFFASFLSAAIAGDYESLAREVAAETRGAIRLVPTGTQHLTLAFLGEIPAEDVGRCQTVLLSCEGAEAFSISLGLPRVLYARKTPRLVSVPVELGRESVAALQERLVQGLSVELPDFETRPKPPHVTLARFRKARDRSDARRVEEALGTRAERFAERRDRIAHVRLVSSRLTPRGPIYDTIAEARFGGS